MENTYRVIIQRHGDFRSYSIVVRAASKESAKQKARGSEQGNFDIVQVNQMSNSASGTVMQ